MIVLLASFPRSGNTLFRIAANAVLGASSADIYDPDPMAPESDAGKEVASLIGHGRLADIGAEHSPAFLKTHEPADPTDARPAVCVLRDGRDAYVSYAHFAKAFFPSHLPSEDYHEVLRMLVQSPDHFQGWSRHVESWLARKAPTTFVRYDDLVANPEKCVIDAAQALGLQVRPTGRLLPEFDRLHALMPSVFRKGKTGNWRDEMPPDIEELFWQHHGATMMRLGYPR